eukprot:tig00000989_g6083.t1
MPEGNAKPRRRKPVPPEKPEPGDCCGSGCATCVMDMYYEACERYEKELELWEREQALVAAENNAPGETNSENSAAEPAAGAVVSG